VYHRFNTNVVQFENHFVDTRDGGSFYTVLNCTALVLNDDIGGRVSFTYIQVFLVVTN